MNTEGFDVNGQIWYFLDEGVDVEVLNDTDLQVKLKLFIHKISKTVIVTLVYAKFDAIYIIELWDSLYYIANDMTLP